jgi:TonB-dependent SusC/RagA subfamily outer membrane receptor
MYPTLYYLLQVLVCSAVLMVYYLLVLRNKKFHQYNRFYLLGVALVSWIVPLIKIFWQQERSGVRQVDLLNVVAVNNSEMEAMVTSQQHSLDWVSLLPHLYVGVSVFLAVAMLISLYRIYKIYTTHECSNLQQFYLVMTRVKGTPFSFFSYIFWNAEIDIQTPAGKQILQHELTHVTQYHSIDKIVIQLNLIAGWFNPFFWLLKKELDMIHEFIADKKSVEHGDAASLAQMLLTTAYPGQQFPLTNPFFFSPIKRRLKMLTNVKKPSFSYARRIVVLPLLSIVVLLFSFRTKEEKMIAPVSMMDTTKKVMIVQGYKISPQDTLITSKGNNKSSVVIKMDGAGLTNQFVWSGEGSSNNGQKPLFILDGEVISESVMSVIDPNKIESINILKDASAVAVFGEKGKGGVVQITTKKGGSEDAPATGRIVVRGDRVIANSRILEEGVVIISDTVQLNGKTVLLKSNNLKDVRFMENSLKDIRFVERSTVEAGKKSGITFSVGSDFKESPSLIFVDGEKKTKKEMDALSPDQIKSVEILKGESAIKAYGPDAKDGVIKITTKKKVNL